jgi:hypothetical protein
MKDGLVSLMVAGTLAAGMLCGCGNQEETVELNNRVYTGVDSIGDKVEITTTYAYHHTSHSSWGESWLVCNVQNPNETMGIYGTDEKFDGTWDKINVYGTSSPQRVFEARKRLDTAVREIGIDSNLKEQSKKDVDYLIYKRDRPY